MKSRISFVCTQLTSFNSSYFLVQPCHTKHRMLSISTFSNRLIWLITLKNCFLMRTKALYSMRMCLKVQGIWHVKNCGWWLGQKRKNDIGLWDQEGINWQWVTRGEYITLQAQKFSWLNLLPTSRARGDEFMPFSRL